MDTKPDPNRRRSLQDLLEAEAEASATSTPTETTTPERSIPLSSSTLSRAKLNLGSLVPLTTRNLGGTSPIECPHSAPVVQSQPTGVGARVSSHRRKLSVASSIGGSFRLASPSFDTNGSNSSPNTAGRSPLSAGGRVVGRLSSLLKRESSAHSLDEDAEQGYASSELEALILDSHYRHALVSDLLANRLRNASLAVRFINGVHMWKATADPKDRRVKGRKLLAVFFDPTSKYFINDLPKELLSSLHHDNVDALEPAKQHLLRALESNELVINFMKQVHEETTGQFSVHTNRRYLAEMSASSEAMELA